MSDTPTDPFSESILADSTIDRASAAARTHPRPKQVGPYHILELLGEGGMGEVYKAERREPIHQTVAVKIIQPGLDSREVVA
ncbi:MAG TPA: hypothetical protein PLD59_12220, partial [Tepidisphaeraceae bacterium]|nr:hypothetical protein [Tepidisphaeraceae bacterium]